MKRIRWFVAFTIIALMGLASFDVEAKSLQLTLEYNPENSKIDLKSWEIKDFNAKKERRSSFYRGQKLLWIGDRTGSRLTKIISLGNLDLIYGDWKDKDGKWTGAIHQRKEPYIFTVTTQITEDLAKLGQIRLLKSKSFKPKQDRDFEKLSTVWVSDALLNKAISESLVQEVNNAN